MKLSMRSPTVSGPPTRRGSRTELSRSRENPSKRQVRSWKTFASWPANTSHTPPVDCKNPNVRLLLVSQDRDARERIASAISAESQVLFADCAESGREAL